MKGKATFTLKEAATGRVVREFTEHNLVTDAVANIFNLPRPAIMGNYMWENFIKAALPIHKNLVGGIMLLGNTLPERKDNIMLSSDCIPVATAGDDYSGDLTTRGSRNLNESYATANGYHFTWDFGTDKANGTIKSVALTSRAFGNSGFGFQKAMSGFIFSSCYLEPNSVMPEMFTGKGQYIATVDKCTHVYLRSISSRALTFAIVKTLDPDNILINDVAPMLGYNEPERTVEVTFPFDLYSSQAPFLDSRNKRLLFASANTRVSQELGRIEYAWVSYEDFSVTTGTWDLQNFLEVYTTLAIYNNRLYLYSGKKIFEFDSSGKMLRTWDNNGYSGTPFHLVNDVLMVTADSNLAMYINGDFVITNNWGRCALFGSSDIHSPYYAAAQIGDLTRVRDSSPYMVLAGNYFATINNLSEPIEKTNEHTLKISYDITN